MSSISQPWPTAPTAADKTDFRNWLQRATSPNGPGLGAPDHRVHPVIRPLLLQAELGRGCNGMVLDALAAGPEHLPERLSVVSERIFDCLDFAVASNRALIGDLATRLMTPIDAEDLMKLSQLFVQGIEQLANVTSIVGLMAVASPATRPIHSAIAESFVLTADALGHLGDRDYAHASYVRLSEQHRQAKAFARQYFGHLMEAAQSVTRSLAIDAVQRGYRGIVDHLGIAAGTLYRTSLKNG